MSSNLRAADSTRFREACAKYATGIAIVTALDPEGISHGMTANSFTSVSLHPPLVLVCVDRTAAILRPLLASARMGINVLNEAQRELSMRFARPGGAPFEAADWHRGEIGVPLLGNALAHFECEIVDTLESGDHTIVIGEVAHASHRAGRPLLYFDRDYRVLGS